MASSAPRSLVFIDEVTADRRSKMNCEVDRAMLSAHIQPNTAKLSASQRKWISKANSKGNLRVSQSKEM